MPYLNGVGRYRTLLLLLGISCGWTTIARSATYYVSSTGSDTAVGTTVSSAWRTIARVNSAPLLPGDRILLEGSRVHSGTLAFQQGRGGTAGQPVLISSYGIGTATIQPTDNDPGVTIHNTAGLRFTNLDVVGSGRTMNRANGFDVYTDLPNNTKLAGLEIRNVNVVGFGKAGISIGGMNGKSGFADLRIVNVSAFDNGLAGINVWGTYQPSVPGYCHRNIYVGYSRVFNNSGVPGWGSHSGSGIVISEADGGTIERSVAYNNGWLNDHAKGGPLGIWVWYVNRFIIQYNESFGNRSRTIDGGGFDLDGGTQNSILQYNYSHDNEGSGFVLCQFSFAQKNQGNIIRYNISQNDGRRNGFAGIHLYSTIFDAHIYNNTVYMSRALTGIPKGVYIQGQAVNVGFRNNIIVSQDTPVMNVTAGQTSLRFENNNYWAGGASLGINWGGTQYSRLADWRQATGQERLGQAELGFEGDPLLRAVGTGKSLKDASLLTSMHQYRLQPKSPLVNRGTNMNVLLGMRAGDRDFYGNVLGRDGGADLGANELSAGDKASLGDGLVAYWKLDESGGTAITDVTGNGRSGSLSSAVLSGGLTGGGLSFDGVNSFASITSAMERVEESSFTVSAWFRPLITPPGNGAANDAYYGILTKRGYHLGLYYSYANRFGMSMFLNGNVGVGPESAETFAPGQFHHVVGVVDRAARETKIYVNGVFQNAVRWPSRDASYNWGANTWKIGIAAPGAYSWRWAANGIIDEVRIYNRAVSDAEVASLFSIR